MPSVAPYLLEYARYHGLATDHRAVDLDLSALLDIAANDTPNPSSSNPPLVPPSSLQPKLKLKKSELQLLATILQPPSHPSWDDIRPDRHRVRDLKLEIPLLVTDHQDDLRCFSGRPSIDFDNLGIFPEDDNEQSKQWDTKMAQKKLQVTKDDIMYLQKILQDPYSPESYEQLVRDALPGYTRVRMMKSLEDEEMELEEDTVLQESQQPLGAPTSPSTSQVLPSTSPAFSATRSLLSFMSTRGEDKRLVPTSSHPSAAGVTGGGTV